eukprot:TRINITY_DN23500_c0_g1_i1.p1 TRINITY_DN23500_c0_g1~~TRINITY_DN23500_c0_g1_i1.p1  ORF type:complete len:850 (+),score=128.94 TRINITY_DN23500_c0_g1_i1:100-2649(+)
MQQLHGQMSAEPTPPCRRSSTKSQACSGCTDAVMPRRRRRTLLSVGVVFQGVTLATRPLGSSALSDVVTVKVPSSARQLIILQGSMRTNCDDDAIAEPMTMVPECKWYRKLACTCEHVIFYQGGRFLPGWERLWHLPTMQQALVAQRQYRWFEDGEHMQRIGSHFWHSSGMGTFKNSFDVTFFVMSLTFAHFPLACEASVECLLSEVLLSLLNWLMHLKQFALAPPDDMLKVDERRRQFEDVTMQVVLEKWANAPWEALLAKPQWLETFLYVTDNLKMYAEVAQGKMPELLAADMPQSDAGFRADCSEPNEYPDVEPLPQSVQEAVQETFATAAFGDARCGGRHPLWRIVNLAKRLRQFSGNTVDYRPTLVQGAEKLLPKFMYRLCAGQRMLSGAGASTAQGYLARGRVQQRRVGATNLHFLVADVVRRGGDVLVELLWYVSSDDECVMVGTDFHNKGKSYYSWAHMLPRAHLNHWLCGAAVAGSEVETREAATSISFSGFLSITACRLPPQVASIILASDDDSGRSSPPRLELELTSHSGEPVGTTWSPEPLRLCPVPRPRQRFLSACTGTLHNADYIDSVMPYAIEDWLNYHFLIGIEHITVLDTDGSFAPYLEPFIKKGLVEYWPRFPEAISDKFGLLTAGVAKKDRRPVLLEPHALDVCLWSYRHVSDWVAVLHSFEEYLHSPSTVQRTGRFSLSTEMRKWVSQVERPAVFELYQEPMGSSAVDDAWPQARSTLSAWRKKRSLEISTDQNDLKIWQEASTHYQAFAWIADPLNVLQTAVHFAQARADQQAVVCLSKEALRVNHYLDLGSNTTRCAKELGGCHVQDDSILWAEEAVVSLRPERELR